MLLLGYDIGSSSIKASLVDASNGELLAHAFYPSVEMEIISNKPGWAEQNPETWFNHLVSVTSLIKNQFKGDIKDVSAIGITYQMHGLVAIDNKGFPVRNSIIWCDSRAVEIGNKAFNNLGDSYCLSNLLNSPGNFTASKAAWVKQNEPKVFERIHKIMLPGDYIAYRLTGDVCTTNTGLSEGILWDYTTDSLSKKVLEYYGIDKSLIPSLTPVFGIQGKLTFEAAEKLGLRKGTHISYRAGDQPNSAFSMNVVNPGDIAANAGTSGVIYGVSQVKSFDPLSRVNTFLHVNHSKNDPRYGILLCLNSTGILYSWLKHNIMPLGATYSDMNKLASSVSSGSNNLMVFPFGNGSERILSNIDIGSIFQVINFNIHTKAHLIRAAQEGIVFSLVYGLEIMQQMGIKPKVIRAGEGNLFLSDVFSSTLANLSGSAIDLYNTNGAQGAAIGAGIGCGHFKSTNEAFSTLNSTRSISPISDERLQEVYQNWRSRLTEMVE